MWRANRAAAASSQRASANFAQSLQLRRASRRAASGILAPGDPPAPPNGPTDFYDYRGVAIQRELRSIRSGDFEVGRLIDPRRGLSMHLGLSESIMERHAAVIGPTGSGKTKSVLVPWIATALRLGHSVVAIDVGGDLLDDLDRHRSWTGPLNASVAVWDFSTPNRSISWNWLEDLTDDSSIVAAIEAIRGRPKPNDSQPFFHERDLRLLRALIELVKHNRQGATAQDLLSTVRDQAAMTNLVMANARHPAAARVPDFLSMAASGRYPEMVSGVINSLELWDNPGMKQVTTHSQLQLDDVLNQPALLVVGAPIHAGRMSEAASSLMLSQVINRLYRRFTSGAGNHVFLIVDEAARLTDRLRFEELLSVARRARVTVVIATQDVGQFADENERLAILGNCATVINLPSRSKPNAEYLLSRLGNRFESSMALSHDPSRTGAALSTSRSISQVPMLGLREVLDPPWGERSAVVHCQPASGKPFLVDLSREEFASS